MPDLLNYLSNLSFSHELKFTAARCYRLWLAAYLEDESHLYANQVRYWIIPYSPDYYDLFMSTTDRLENDKLAATKRAENKARIDQLDMFSRLSPNKPDTENADCNTDSSLSTPDEESAPFSKDEVIQMMFETQQIRESAPIAEYDYVSSDVTDIFIAALERKTASGGFRYKHGALASALFTGTIMLGLRPREWQHATYHDSYTDPDTLLTLCPIVEVFTLNKHSGLYTRFELAAMIGHTKIVNQRYYTLDHKYTLKTYSHTLPRPWPGDAGDIEQWCNDTLSTLSANDI